MSPGFLKGLYMNNKYQLHIRISIVAFLLIASAGPASAWHDETHLAIAKVVGYWKWYNAAGADMIKLKARQIEQPNHYVNNPAGAIVTPAMVLKQVGKYNQPDTNGHLYGAIIASVRNYVKNRQKGKYGEYHLAFCAHYVGDLSNPFHNTPYDLFNIQYHKATEAFINQNILDHLDRIQTYPITIESEKDLATEIARIANLAIQIRYQLEMENRLITKKEAYVQLGHSASLLKAILKYVQKYIHP